VHVHVSAFIGCYLICPRRDGQAEFTCVADCILEIMLSAEAEMELKSKLFHVD